MEKGCLGIKRQKETVRYTHKRTDRQKHR